MKPYTLALPVGQPIELAVVGDYVRLKAALVPVVVRVEDTGESVELEPGDDANLTRFSRLSVAHASGTEQTVTLYVGNGTRAGSSKVGGAVSVSGIVSVKQAQPALQFGSALAPAIAALMLPQNLNRSFLLLQNKSTTKSVQFSFEAGATDELSLPADGLLIFDGLCPTGEIYLRESTATASVFYMHG